MRLMLAAVLLCSAVTVIPASAASQAPGAVQTPTAPQTAPPQAAAPQPAAPQAAAPQPTAKGRLREEQRAYIGRQVRVHLTDGTTAHGRLIGETEQGLAIQPAPSDEPMLIPYEQVESIAVGMRRWKKIAIGVGAAAAVTALAFGMN